MIQSARSGKQNILEGSKAAQTSKETEIKLTNVGRASLEELLADYRDFLRVRDHVIWDKDSKEARFVRRLGCKTPQTFEIYREFMDTRPPEVLANIAICLIHQTNYLIDQQLKTLEKEFIQQGGLRERMTRVRLANRNQGRKRAIYSVTAPPWRMGRTRRMGIMISRPPRITPILPVIRMLPISSPRAANEPGPCPSGAPTARPMPAQGNALGMRGGH